MAPLVKEGIPMSRRRLLIVMSAATLLGVPGFAVYLWLTSPAHTPGVTWENFRRLREGMSPKDVEALLREQYEADECFHGTTRFWQGGEVEIFLGFVADRLAWGVAFPPGQDHSHVEHLHTDVSWESFRRLTFGRDGRLTFGAAKPRGQNLHPGEHLRTDNTFLDRMRRLLHL